MIFLKFFNVIVPDDELSTAEQASISLSFCFRIVWPIVSSIFSSSSAE